MPSNERYSSAVMLRLAGLATSGVGCVQSKGLHAAPQGRLISAPGRRGRGQRQDYRGRRSRPSAPAFVLFDGSEDPLQSFGRFGALTVVGKSTLGTRARSPRWSRKCLKLRVQF